MDTDNHIRQVEQIVPAVTNHLLLFPKFARLLLALFRDPRVPRYLKILTAGTVAYVALPFDVLPDFAPLAGKGDDLLVVFLVLVQYLKRCPPEALAEHWGTHVGDISAAEDRLREAASALGPIVGRRFDYLEDTIHKIAQRLEPPAES